MISWSSMLRARTRLRKLVTTFMDGDGTSFPSLQAAYMRPALAAMNTCWTSQPGHTQLMVCFELPVFC